MNRRNCISRHGNCNRPASNFRKTRHSRQSHIVGYNSIANVAPGRYYPLAIQFTDVGSTQEIAIKDILVCSNPKSRPALHSWADMIHVWNGMGWVKYFYSTSNTWCLENTTEETKATVKSGDTVFFVRSARGNATGDSITLSGAVTIAAQPITTSLASGKYYFLSYPWPVQFAIADFKECLSNPIGRPSLHPWADQIHRWDGMGWQKYYYDSNKLGFVKDGESDVTTEKLNVGEGVFFVRSARGLAGDTITFTKPEGL